MVGDLMKHLAEVPRGGSALVEVEEAPARPTMCGLGKGCPAVHSGGAT